MIRYITTESGARYEVDGHRLRRLGDESDQDKRGDGDWLTLRVLLPDHSLVGRRMFLFLESLSHYGPDDHGNPAGNGEPTLRTTTPVTSDSFHPERTTS